MKELIKKHQQKIRFGIVGVGLTALDFGLLFLIVSLGVNEIVANYFSTGISFIVSFFVNRAFTFKVSGGGAKRQFVLFIAVTMFGLWALQPAVIAGSLYLIGGLGFSESINLFAAKVLATGVSMVWNYVLYARLVFKNKD